jgi:hypothetical protein
MQRLGGPLPPLVVRPELEQTTSIKTGRYEDVTDKLLRSSAGSEMRVKVSRFPHVRLIFSWNPLRLDDWRFQDFVDLAFNFRVGLDR